MRDMTERDVTVVIAYPATDGIDALLLNLIKMAHDVWGETDLDYDNFARQVTLVSCRSFASGPGLDLMGWMFGKIENRMITPGRAEHVPSTISLMPGGKVKCTVTDHYSIVAMDDEADGPVEWVSITINCVTIIQFPIARNDGDGSIGYDDVDGDQDVAIIGRELRVLC